MEFTLSGGCDRDADFRAQVRAVILGDVDSTRLGEPLDALGKEWDHVRTPPRVPANLGDFDRRECHCLEAHVHSKGSGHRHSSEEISPDQRWAHESRGSIALPSRRPISVNS